MIKQQLFIEKYDWHLTVLYKANKDISTVVEALWFIKCPYGIATQAIQTIIAKRNNGFCFTNNLIKSTLIGISETDSDEQLVNTVAHEVKHMQSHICSYYNIDERSEEAAYLIGDTVEELYKVFKYELEQS